MNCVGKVMAIKRGYKFLQVMNSISKRFTEDANGAIAVKTDAYRD